MIGFAFAFSSLRKGERQSSGSGVECVLDEGVDLGGAVLPGVGQGELPAFIAPERGIGKGPLHQRRHLIGAVGIVDQRRRVVAQLW